MQEFTLHSPDFEAAKFWVGNMGKTATHAVVFAQLYTPGGHCHGPHAFVVQVRGSAGGVALSREVAAALHPGRGVGSAAGFPRARRKGEVGTL